LDIRFVAVLPVLTPATDLGRLYTDAYATQAGLSQEKFMERFGGALTGDVAGRSISELAANDSYTDPAYALALTGLQPMN
jgi:hypothetical protein